MADNTTLPGTGTVVATDERTIAATAVQVQRVDEIGSSAITTAQVNISNAHASIVAARDTRKRVTIYNRQLSSVFIGPDGVAITDGLELQPGAAFTSHTTAEIFGITAAASGATEKVHVFEEHD
jgi:hypothetical protein